VNCVVVVVVFFKLISEIGPTCMFSRGVRVNVNFRITHFKSIFPRRFLVDERFLDFTQSLKKSNKTTLKDVKKLIFFMFKKPF